MSKLLLSIGILTTLACKGAQSEDRQLCRPTASDVLGPFYKPKAPLHQASRTSFATVCDNSEVHDRILINGTVFKMESSGPCRLPQRALLEIWQANAEGAYSERATSSTDYVLTCRARIITDANGFFAFSSRMPGRYNDGGLRPAHIHFRITALNADNKPITNSKPLVTQMYFARDRFLAPVDSCGICKSDDPTLISHVRREYDVKTLSGTWDIVLQ